MVLTPSGITMFLNEQPKNASSLMYRVPYGMEYDLPLPAG